MPKICCEIYILKICLPARGVPSKAAIPRPTTKRPKELVRRSTPSKSLSTIEVRQM